MKERSERIPNTAALHFQVSKFIPPFRLKYNTYYLLQANLFSTRIPGPVFLQVHGSMGYAKDARVLSGVSQFVVFMAAAMATGFTIGVLLLSVRPGGQYTLGQLEPT